MRSVVAHRLTLNLSARSRQTDGCAESNHRDAETHAPLDASSAREAGAPDASSLMIRIERQQVPPKI
jgi:hypothetical protein